MHEKVSLYPGWLPGCPFRGLDVGTGEDLESVVADTQTSKWVNACPRPGHRMRGIVLPTD
ncbi:uncharacterized protein N7496_010085 [Penicillium cataractarum]|uniref:Uncharacterized protein n=1 Tax=Penicillium cataractarum TaxID=2100454 RepID=A0A9W9RQ64_9EURO|nr:uncharacterized protein N7496_010085 [Penicillium cataractarum]KAJ5364372.1 hypothetical protein N7496_010085 [Penicillium cataractarum]